MDLITSMKESFLDDFDNFIYDCSVGYADTVDCMIDKIAFIDTAYMYKDAVHIYQYLIRQKIFKVDGTTF